MTATTGAHYGTVLPVSVPVADHPRLDALVAVALMLGTALLGAPLGLLWAEVAPHTALVVQDGFATTKEFETESFVAGDGWFLILSLLAGALTGTVVYVIARRHGAIAVVAMVIGSLAAAWIAWRVGHRVGLPGMQDFIATGGEQGTPSLAVQLRAKGVLVAWPIFALVMFVGLLMSSDRGGHRSGLS